MSSLSSSSTGLSPNGLRGVKKMVCLPSLLSRPPTMSPDLRIEGTSKEHPSMEQEFFPFVWNSDVIHQLRHYHILTSVSLNGKNVYTKRNFWNSCNTRTSSCYFLYKCVEANLSPRIFALRHSEMLSAVWTHRFHGQRRQFLVHIDHNNVPTHDQF